METDFITYSQAFYEKRYQAGEISYHTWNNGASIIRGFGRFCLECRQEEQLPFSQLGTDIFQQFKQYCIRKGNSRETINRKMVPIVVTLKNAEREGLIPGASLAAIEKIYYSAQIRRYGEQADRLSPGEGDAIHHLNDAQLKQLLEYRRSVGECASLDLFFFSFYACGLRISDLLTLEWKHIDLVKGCLSKVSFKSKRVIAIPLSAQAMEILLRWEKKTGQRRFVFSPFPDSFDLTDDAALAKAIDNGNRNIRSSLNRIGRRFGFPFPLGMHVARHTFAVKALNDKGVSVHMISCLLGHSSVMVTEKVYARFLMPTLANELREKLCFPEFKNEDYL